MLAKLINAYNQLTGQPTAAMRSLAKEYRQIDTIAEQARNYVEKTGQNTLGQFSIEAGNLLSPVIIKEGDKVLLTHELGSGEDIYVMQRNYDRDTTWQKTWLAEYNQFKAASTPSPTTALRL